MDHKVNYFLPLFRFFLLQTIFLAVPSAVFTCLFWPCIPFVLLPLTKTPSWNTRESKELPSGLVFWERRRWEEQRKAIKLLRRWEVPYFSFSRGAWTSCQQLSRPNCRSAAEFHLPLSWPEVCVDRVGRLQPLSGLHANTPFTPTQVPQKRRTHSWPCRKPPTLGLRGGCLMNFCAGPTEVHNHVHTHTHTYTQVYIMHYLDINAYILYRLYPSSSVRDHFAWSCFS